jgi:aspartate ammonia-lyase
MATRIERDALGERELPADVYWGLQTLRAQENFPISGISEPPVMIEAYVLLKKAAAQANTELGLLPEPIGRAIIQAADEILQGNLRDQFPTDIFHQGAGTSFHMNVNEVLANRAIEILGGQKGDYSMVNPNDHPNFGQSTNDTFPTAMRIATRLAMRDLFPALDALTDAFAQKGKEFDHVLKSGRTHLQDAVPIRLGQEFAAYAATLRKCRRVLEFAAEAVEELGIGGSAVGTGLNTHPKYRFRVVELLREWTGSAVPTRRRPARGDAEPDAHPACRLSPAHARAGADPHRERPAPALVGTADGLRRNHPARRATGQQHHAWQGKPQHP